MGPLSIVGAGTTISTSGTSAAANIPNNAANKNPTFVRVAATAAAYVKLGNGSGATATSRLGAVSAAVNTAGSGYAVNDTITLAGGTNTVPAVLIVTAVTGGAIDTVDVQTAGTYTVLPTNPVSQDATSGSGTGADFNVTWGVSSVVVTDGGSEYATAPTVSFSGGAGSGAAATATITDGVVTAVTVTDEGTGYTSAPTVAFAETTTAAAGDVLVQPGDAVILQTAGASRIAAIQVSTGGVVQVSPMEGAFR